jgi:hypothetical protein
VVAPFDGVVTQQNIDIGNLVQADNTDDTSMFSLAKSDIIQYQRAAKTAGLTAGLTDPASLAVQCPRHQMFKFQLEEGGWLKPERCLKALIRDDVLNPKAVLQLKYKRQIVVNVRAHSSLKSARAPVPMLGS